jgi:transcriptional regulator GlxA family with amidase domain
MDGHLGETLAVSQAGQKAGQVRSGDWIHHVIALLDAAIGHLHPEQAAHGAIVEATSLLQRQVDPQPVEGAADDGRERLLAWQARKVLDYIDGHITSRVLVGDLCALVWRSEAHFSRSFRATFGYSPHAFVIRRRVELAAKHMLQTDMSLSDIALGCGFVDQAHLCKHFRVVIGETPAAWRRAKREQDADMAAIPVQIPQSTCSCRYPPPAPFLCRARRTQASKSSAANGFMR